jgi:ATP synthase protein I
MDKKHAPLKGDLGAFKWLGTVWVAVGSIIGGALLGWLLDQVLGTSPLLLVVFLLLGVGGGFWKTYTTIMKGFENK